MTYWKTIVPPDRPYQTGMLQNSCDSSAVWWTKASPPDVLANKSIHVLFILKYTTSTCKVLKLQPEAYTVFNAQIVKY